MNSTFEAMHVRRESSFTVNQPLEKVFPLFTPKGEGLWGEGWKPTYLYPKSGETEQGMVFVTGQSSEDHIIWRMEIYDPSHGRVRYSRISPSNRYGVVEVECRAGAAGTEVTVTYEFTALSEAGNAFIREYSEEKYRVMIGTW